MMFKKYILGALLLSLLVMASSSCSRTEDLLFDRTPAERMLDLIEEAQKTLVANPNGWEMKYALPVGPTDKYAPQSSFVLQFQFQADKSVKIWGDYAEQPETSSYSFTLSRGPVLSFDTYGRIHDLANPAITAYRGADKGKGHYGEFDFEILSVSPDEIKLRGLKYRKELSLIPLKEAPNAINNGTTGKVHRWVAAINSLGGRVSLYVADDAIARVAFKIPKLTRYITPSEIPTIPTSLTFPSANEGGEPTVKEYELVYKEGGFGISPAVEANGKQHDTFVYDAKKDVYVSSSDETVSIKRDMSLISAKLLYGVYVDGFYMTDMSPELNAIAGEDKLGEIFSEFATIQWYNMANLKSMTFFHQPEGKNNWQNLALKELKIVNDSEGIYQLPITGNVSGAELLNSINEGLKGGNKDAAFMFCYYFTSIGKSTVKITEVTPDQKVRLTSSHHVKAPGDIWVEFQAFGN